MTAPRKLAELLLAMVFMASVDRFAIALNLPILLLPGAAMTMASICGLQPPCVV
jgi:hypothetical protein